ncbi:M1 family metallopeptidase [Rudanella lutea]|uniref:M1 family metallopeptidase n=1 Tax=Rudanella lutea TaxID=451374 RepID=UPI00037B3E6E|nr:M1 family metallopeptidase [Rudanella lutea]
MNRFLLFLLACLLGGEVLAFKPTQPLSPRIANYQIDVSLDPATKRLTGRQTLRWRNTSNDPITELQFHLYLNAFRNEKSTFMRESGGQLRGDYIDKDDKEAWGWIDLLSTRLTHDGGAGTTENLTGKAQFIQPDDANPDDRTVVRIPLNTPVRPGETVAIDMAFRAKLPKIFARTGFSRDYFLVGQWFPKIGVYEAPGTRYQTGPRGRWNCHQFHAHSEFYADFGVYDVRITTPAEYIVGATGQLKNETRTRNGLKAQHWHADDVVDFAWTASPRYEVVEDTWTRPSGGSVRIQLLMQPEHRAQADRHLHAVKASLSYFDRVLGRYPYPTLTVVDPPIHASGSAGMEYPTFITAGTSWGLPAGVRAPEMVTVHEFGHQYFMQLLASNEFEEAWLDEGFNQYFEGRIMDETYGPQTSQVDLFGFRMGDMESSRDSYVRLDNPAIGPSFGNTWQLPDGYYGVLTYSKTATWLRTLEGLVGRKAMDEIMRTYFERWQFRHPNAQNFIAIVNEIAPARTRFRYGPDMNWFFDQVLYGDKVCDYELTKIRNRKQGTGYRSTVQVTRRGDAQMPVDVLVHFEDGNELMLFWDGKARTQTFTLNQPSAVRWAIADPKQKLYIDTNLNNNSLTLAPSSAPAAKYAAKMLFWVQNWMQWLAWLF